MHDPPPFLEGTDLLAVEALKPGDGLKRGWLLAPGLITPLADYWLTGYWPASSWVNPSCPAASRTIHPRPPPPMSAKSAGPTPTGAPGAASGFGAGAEAQVQGAHGGLGAGPRGARDRDMVRPTTLEIFYLIDKSHRYLLLRPYAREICIYPTRSEAFL